MDPSPLWDSRNGLAGKWAVYVPSLSKDTKEKLKTQYKGTTINGYWDVIGNRKDVKKDRPSIIKHEELSRRDLNLIFKLLQYYNKKVITGRLTGADVLDAVINDDNTPLARYCSGYCGKEKKPPKIENAHEDDRITFIIESEEKGGQPREYELKLSLLNRCVDW